MFSFIHFVPKHVFAFSLIGFAVFIKILIFAPQ